jgi:pre-mRNA-splicing factor SYF1
LLIEERYYEDALRVVKHVLFRRKQDGEAVSRKTDEALRSHPALWQLYIDLEINLGNFSQIKTAFERCKEHRSLTPLMLLKYAQFLWDSLYFEETFRVFEFALSNFKWPALYEIWLAYISKFITRHAATPAGVERARSMFERLLREAPPAHCFIFYFSYAEF